MIANISEAKAHLSQIVDRAYHGETVVIAKNGTPLVDLVPHRPSQPRRLGLLAGKLSVPDDFSEESEEINAMFSGAEM
jgi:prevent-host-death family protein